MSEQKAQTVEQMLAAAIEKETFYDVYREDGVGGKDEAAAACAAIYSDGIASLTHSNNLLREEVATLREIKVGYGEFVDQWICAREAELNESVSATELIDYHNAVNPSPTTTTPEK